jgi:transcriptional regulator with XRE-family HTH domain
MVNWDVVRRRLVERREAAGITGKEAAAATGVSHSYISNLENGHGEPNAVALFGALARTYSTSVDYLLGVTDDPRPMAQDREWSQEAAHAAHLLGALTPLARANALELLAIYAEQERKRAEEAAAQNFALTALEAILPRSVMEELIAILDDSVASGEDDAVINARINRLLAPEDKPERIAEETSLPGAGLRGDSQQP